MKQRLSKILFSLSIVGASCLFSSFLALSATAASDTGPTQTIHELKGNSHSEEELNAIFYQLDQHQIPSNSIALFDVDGTAIPDNCFAEHPAPNAKVLSLYNELKRRGVQLYFLTARLDFFGSLDSTEIQLNNAGYTDFIEIIGMPMEKKEEISEKEQHACVVDLNAEWKASEREKLAQRFNVIATVDDTIQNLMGNHTGLKIWVR